MEIAGNLKHSELIAARCHELRGELEKALASYRANHIGLAERYRVANVAPRPYTETTRAAIVKRSEECREPWNFAWTSGTTSEPKQILYPASRLQALQNHYVDQVLLATEAYGVSSPRFYCLNSLTPDRSISSLLANAPLPSPLAEELLGDYDALRQSAVKLASRYSTLALCWALIWSLRPAVVTTVNPSSLCVVLRKGVEAWPKLCDQVPQIFGEPEWQAALNSRGLAAATLPSSPAELLPDVELIYCWQGGYVRPFVEQLRELLLPRRVELALMFSLSTEVVAASNFPHLSREAGLPIYPECCYEFLPLDAEPAASNVLPPWRLVQGEEYRMVVSDPYGLTRYDTEDVFRCVGHAGDAPLIEFQRRFGLAYSFTGEKLTDCQLQEAYADVAKANGLSGATFTCFPRRTPGPLPGYTFVLVAHGLHADTTTLAHQLDDALCRINSEYASKRTSDRLTAPELVVMPAEALTAKLMAALPRTASANPGQFKLLPLYTVLWEEVMPAAKESP